LGGYDEIFVQRWDLMVGDSARQERRQHKVGTVTTVQGRTKNPEPATLSSCYISLFNLVTLALAGV